MVSTDQNKVYTGVDERDSVNFGYNRELDESIEISQKSVVHYEVMDFSSNWSNSDLYWVVKGLKSKVHSMYRTEK